MSFASIEFFLLVVVVLGLHYLWREKFWQNSVILSASYVFYAWWDYRFCFLMLASSLIDYAGGILIYSSGSKRRKKQILTCTLTANLFILGFFKYYNFFVDNVVISMSVLGVELNTSSLNIILPAGISFYTFQTMSYTIDVYRGVFKPERNLLDYLAFVSYFPQLVAGPIERAAHLIPQFKKSRHFNYVEAISGARLVLWGLVKKMALADNLAKIVQQYYGTAGVANGTELAIATVAFAFQIYYDFSAYSDIAAGVSRFFGVELMRNFAYPYFSQNLAEFWRRWHISLMSWFRDYVYIPLGGRSPDARRTNRNLMITFLLSGLWHGAAWTFIAWGALNGALLSLTNTIRTRLRTSAVIPGGESNLPSPTVFLKIAVTFFVICVGWVLFRARTFADAIMIYKKSATDLVTFDFLHHFQAPLKAYSTTIMLVIIAVTVEWIGRRKWNPLPIPANKIFRWSFYTALVWLIIFLGTEQTADFIYFQF